MVNLENVSRGKWLLYTLLENRPTLDGVIIPVRIIFSPPGTLPAITMSESAGPAPDNMKTGGLMTPLPEDHPYFDPENPGEKYCTKRVFQEKSRTKVSLHCWAYSDKEAVILANQVRSIIKSAGRMHYQFCTKYDRENGHCLTTGEECDAITVNNRFSVNGKCPYLDITDEDSPKYRGPDNYFNLTGISSDLIKIGGNESIADLQAPKPEYRRVIEFDMEVDETEEVPVNPICKVEINRTEEFLE